MKPCILHCFNYKEMDKGTKSTYWYNCKAELSCISFPAASQGHPFPESRNALVQINSGYDRKNIMFMIDQLYAS